MSLPSDALETPSALAALDRGRLITALEVLDGARHQCPPPEATILRVVDALRDAGVGGELAAVLDDLGEAEGDQLSRALTDAVLALREALGSGRDARAIVVAEASPAIRRLLAGVLEPCADVVQAATCGEVRRVLAERPAAVLVLDLDLEDGDARELLLSLRRAPHTARLPIVVLGTETAPLAAQECLALGADTYLAKPVELSHLRTVVGRHLFAAPTPPPAGVDVVTGLRSRAGMSEAFRLQRARALADGCPFSVGLLRLHDANGHRERDRLLRWFGGRLAAAARPTEVVARWEGAEFVVLLPETPGCEARVRLEELQRALRRSAFRSLAGELLSPAVSVVAVAQVEPSVSAEPGGLESVFDEPRVAPRALARSVPAGT